MSTEKQLIKLEDELSKRNAEYFKQHGYCNIVLVTRINAVREAIKENAVGSMI